MWVIFWLFSTLASVYRSFNPIEVFKLVDYLWRLAHSKNNSRNTYLLFERSVVLLGCSHSKGWNLMFQQLDVGKALLKFRLAY